MLFCRYLLGSFGSVLRAALFSVLNAHRIQGATDDVIPYSGQILHPSTSNEDNGVFLEVMTNTWDVGSHFDAVSQANTGNFSKSGVRFLWSCGIDTDTNPPLLGRSC